MTYFSHALTPDSLEEVLALAKKRLGRIKYHAIAVSGCSGTLVAGAFAVALQKQIILVRKTIMGTHAHSLVECTASMRGRAAFRYIIIDDFIDTGGTIRRIRKQVEKELPKGRLVGVYPYQMDNPHGMMPQPGFRIFNPCGGYYTG